MCPRISWDLTINTFPLSWVESSLDPLAIKYLKQWLGLAKPADPSRLYLPQNLGGLGLPSIAGLYKKLQVGKAALMLTSRDRGVQLASRKVLEKEAHSQVVKFKPAMIVQQEFAKDPAASYKSLASRSKKSVQRQESEARLVHEATLKIQGRLFEMVEEPEAEAWSTAIQSLPFHLMKFALNAAQDTLPHNVIWARWRMLPDACKLCGKRQTLLHNLNNCPVALHSQRYNQRHDLVLSVIHDFLKNILDDDYMIVSDLAESHNYLFPPILATTDLHPDLVVFSEEKRDAILIELTIPFETNFMKAQQRKNDKYHEVTREVEANGFNVDLITLEVGSRGFVCPDGF